MLIAFAFEFPIIYVISRLTTRSTVRVLLILQYVFLINMQTIWYLVERLESDIWTWIFYLSIIVGAVKSLQDVGENIDDHFYDFVSTIDFCSIKFSCLILVVLVWPLCSCVPSMFRQHRINIAAQYDRCRLHFCTLDNSFCIFFLLSNDNHPLCIYFFVIHFSFLDPFQVGDKLVESSNFVLNFAHFHSSF